MSAFVVGVSAEMYDKDGLCILKELRSEFLDLPLDAELAIVPRSATPLVAPEALRDMDIFVMLGSRFDASSLAGNDRLLAVCRWGVGYDTVNLEDCASAGVVVTNAPEGVKKGMAHSAISFVLALGHRLFDQDRAMRQGMPWATKHEFIGTGLVGKTLGVVGLGNIGQEIVRIASVFDCEILGHDPYVTQDTSLVTQVGLDELMQRSDFVVIQCALTDETRGMISEERIAMMKTTAYLINTARGPIVNEAALTAALQEKQIAGAALDVFEKEPIDPTNPLHHLDNVILTPHSVGWTDYFARATAQSISTSIRSLHQGELPLNTVNRRQLEESGVQGRYLGRKAQGV